MLYLKETIIKLYVPGKLWAVLLRWLNTPEIVSLISRKLLDYDE